MCKEDQELYKMQIKLQSPVGYTTSKVASKSSIRPPKKNRICTEIPFSATGKLDISSTSESSTESASTASEYTVATKFQNKNIRILTQ